MTKAAGILYQANGKVLLLKRSPDADNWPGVWGFPAGGVEAGETPEQAASREFWEETGGTQNIMYGAPKTYGDFALFTIQGEEFTPTLNSEHTEYLWADPRALPNDLHPGIADQISECASVAMDSESAREYDRNGYVTIKRNPITRAGVFQYSGRVLPGGDPNQMYNVYRPLEELQKPETLASMRLLPIINEHEMLGDGYERGPEDRGVHGSTGEEIIIEGSDVFAPLRIFSRIMKKLVDTGKKGLSLGYRCRFEKIAGVFNGITYDYIQRDIRGNHLALVNEGRSGTAVLDHHWAFDHVDLAFDNEEKIMADADKKDKAEDENPVAEKTQAAEPTIADCMAMMEKLMPLLEIADKLKTPVAEALDADEKDDKAEDADDEDKKDDKEKDDVKEKDAMDAAEIKNRITGLESRIPTEKALRAQIKATDQLAGSIAQHVGSFDHSAMDEAEVVAYGVEKLGIKAPKGQERAALDGFLVGASKNKSAAIGYAMDSAAAPKAGGLLSKRINGAQA